MSTIVQFIGAGYPGSMHAAHRGDHLPTATRDAVLARLGLATSVPLTLAGLRALYRAWCTRVPFDNSRKLIALFSKAEGPLPGGDAADFFEHWLTVGSGGTCWPSSNALFALVDACGFDARRVAGSMRDVDLINHGSVKVKLDGRDWLVDSSILTNEPLPLGDTAFVGTHPVVPTEIEPTDGTHIIWFHVPPNPGFFPCRLLVDPADHALYLDRYAWSRERSPFNQYIYARRNINDAMIVVRGPTLFRRTAAGTEQTELTRDELRGVLRDVIGLDSALLAEWEACGAMEASFQPPMTPPPPMVAGLPPSMRNGS